MPEFDLPQYQAPIAVQIPDSWDLPLQEAGLENHPLMGCSPSHPVSVTVKLRLSFFVPKAFGLPW